MGIVRQTNNGGTGDNYIDQLDGKEEKVNPTNIRTNSPKPQAPKKGGKRQGKTGKKH